MRTDCHDEDSLQNNCALVVIGIRHLYHEIYGFENVTKKRRENIRGKFPELKDSKKCERRELSELTGAKGQPFTGGVDGDGVNLVLRYGKGV
jgi:hypothetical protein